MTERGVLTIYPSTGAISSTVAIEHAHAHSASPVTPVSSVVFHTPARPLWAVQGQVIGDIKGRR